ncbi:hypothetical protein ACJRO7_029111, partial [Eucalyptus globulus]
FALERVFKFYEKSCHTSRDKNLDGELVSSSNIGSSCDSYLNEGNEEDDCRLNFFVQEPSYDDFLNEEKKKSDNNLSELDRYLKAELEDGRDLDILKWWSVAGQKFKILSLMARDILSIPVTTVASESTFSTSGRVLDGFRSSLTPRVVEALICTQDWLRAIRDPINVEECIENAEKFEFG